MRATLKPRLRFHDGARLAALPLMMRRTSGVSSVGRAPDVSSGVVERLRERRVVFGVVRVLHTSHREMSATNETDVACCIRLEVCKGVGTQCVPYLWCSVKMRCIAESARAVL